jgi:very-short-patch-repair endonuclease
VRRVIDVPRGSAVARLAARQRGLASRKQLLGLGLDKKTIARWLRSGRLHQVHRGVYLVGYDVLPPLARELAALMACGDGAALGLYAAAESWRMLAVPRSKIDVLVQGRNPGRHAGIAIHRTRQLEPKDVTKRHGMLVTRPGRTLLDLADVASTGQLAIAWDEAHSRGLITPDQIAALTRRSPGRHGIPLLKALLQRDAVPGITKSRAEERLRELIRRALLPTPELNVLLGPYELDFVWRDQQYIVELDGGHHDRPRRRDYDNRRDSELQNAGWRIDHVSRYEVIYEPEAVIARIARGLAATGG